MDYIAMVHKSLSRHVSVVVGCGGGIRVENEMDLDSGPTTTGAKGMLLVVWHVGSS